MMRAVTAFALLAATPALAQGTAVPPDIAKMIDAAYASGDDAAIKTTVDLAKKTYPDAAAGIDAQAKALADKREAARLQAMSEAGWSDLWKGNVDLGAEFSTGNTDTLGIAGGVSLVRDGLKWRHKLTGLAEYQETDDVKTKDRYFASYDINYNITPRLYAVGLFSWEHDTFAGFDNRFIESIGIGYRLVRKPRFELDVEGGIAYRQTDYIFTGWEDDILGRGALDARWTISEGTLFAERVEVYFGGSNTTIQSLTSLTTRIMGSLSGRVSFDYRYQSDPGAGRKNTDTTTRASLVYDF